MNSDTAVLLDSVDYSIGKSFRLQIDHFVVKQGEHVAIVGHNGAGKSTLFRMLSGFVRPTAGSIYVLGRAIHSPISAEAMRTLRCSLGQIMQGLHLVQRLTVLENVLIGGLGRMKGWRSWARCYPPNEMESAKTALRAVGLLSMADARTDQLSGGERQKVAIARLLMQRPQLILADEPTAALDPTAANEICQLIVEAATNVALISVVHNPSLLPLLANRVIGMKYGRIVFDLPIAAVNQQRLDELYSLDVETEKQFAETTSKPVLLPN